MCIAIAKPAGKVVAKEALENGWSNNDDGAGFCFFDDDGKLVIHKSMTWEGFWSEYQVAEEMYGATKDFLIHFRITSRGDTNLDNCHPFIINDDMALIHNGTITSIPMDRKETRSDTKILAEDYLANLPDGWEDNWVIHELIEEYIGSGSKVIVLHKTKGFIFYNESKGKWDDGVWYSNSTYTFRWAKYDKDDYNYYKGGFWSYKESKYITAFEAKTMTQKEIDEHKQVVQIAHKDRDDLLTMCECCRTFHDETDMNPIQVSGGVGQKDKVELWCIDCEKAIKPCTYCQDTYHTKNLNMAVHHDETIDYFCDTCFDYIFEYENNSYKSYFMSDDYRLGGEA